MKSIVGLIPARGGSKGLPGKNVRPLAGKPLIAWTIEAALKSGVLKRVIVSSDDSEISRIARQFGAEIPFQRPEVLSRDDTPALDVALHALDWLEANASLPEVLLLLQPTSPLRTWEDIAAGVTLMENSGAPAVIGVCETKAHPWQVLKAGTDGGLESYLPNQLQSARRQDLPSAYQINGALYLNRCDSLRKDRMFVPLGARPYVMPCERSIDIDTALDFFLAETLMRRQNS